MHEWHLRAAKKEDNQVVLLNKTKDKLEILRKYLKKYIYKNLKNKIMKNIEKKSMIK